MNNSAKKILYATIVAALFMTYQAQPTFCDEKINAGVVYEFYLDVGNQIPANKPIDTKKLPEINNQEVNLAYYKGFRPLNLLSAKNVYTISAPKDKKLKYEKIPKEYSISLNPQKIAAAAFAGGQTGRRGSRAGSFARCAPSAGCSPACTARP